MCKFRSGIIFKDKVIIVQGDDDSHTTLLEELKIEDSTANAMTLFVRAELLPLNGEWWTDPDTWNFRVDQDILPDWFTEDKGKYEAMFREEVKAWWKKHILVNEEVDNLDSGLYMLKGCHIRKLAGDAYIWRMYDSRVGFMFDSSRVGKMYNNSRVDEMWGNSQVGEMWGNSQVWEMRNNSRVDEMWGNSQVGEMWGNSQVWEMYGDSRVNVMHDGSRIEVMCGHSMVCKMFGSNKIGKMYDNSVAIHQDKGNAVLYSV